MSSSLERSRIEDRTHGRASERQLNLRTQSEEQQRQRQQTRDSQSSKLATRRSESAQLDQAQQGQSQTRENQTFEQHRHVQQLLRSQTHEQQEAHQRRRQEQTQYEQHERVETAEQEEARLVKQHVHELRHVREYYSVMEEQIIQAQRFQRLPNRHALVLEQGRGLPKVTRIRTLDLPQTWTTRVGAIDGMCELERLCTPARCEPEPELSLRDRMDLDGGMGMPRGKKWGNP